MWHFLNWLIVSKCVLGLKKNKFFRLWRYKIKIQLYNVCIMCNVWLKIANYILRWSNVQYSMEAFRMSNIRRTADRMSKIRHPKKCALNVEYSKLNGGQYRIENRIFLHTSTTYITSLCLGFFSVCMPHQKLKF